MNYDDKQPKEGRVESGKKGEVGSNTGIDRRGKRGREYYREVGRDMEIGRQREGLRELP